MSEAAYPITIHERAHAELDRLDPDAEAELTTLIVEASKHRRPDDHPRVYYLKGFDDLLAVRIEGWRAICQFDKPHLRVLLVEKRKRVYDRLDVALKRAKENGGAD